MGLLTTALFVTHFGSQLPAGRTIDRLGARRMGLVALAIVVGGNALALLDDAFALALAARVVIGVGTGTGFVAGADYVRSATSSPAAQGLYGGASIGGGGLAIALVPLFEPSLAWRAPYVTALAAALMLGLVLAAGPRDEPRTAHAERARLTELLRERRLYPLAVLHTGSFGVTVVAGNWIVDLLEKHGHARNTAGLVGALVLLLGLITRPAGGWLMRSRPALTRRGLVVSVTAATAALAALALPLALGLLVVAAAVVGLASGIPFAAAFAGAQRLRPDAPAAAIGVVNSAATLAILVGTPLIGLTFSLPGDGRIGFAILAACAAAALPATRRRFW